MRDFSQWVHGCGKLFSHKRKRSKLDVVSEDVMIMATGKWWAMTDCPARPFQWVRTNGDKKTPVRPY
jgi:hypothetical protein